MTNLLLLAIAVALVAHAAQLHRINRRIKHMSTTVSEAIAALNVATNNVAAQITVLRGELVNVATPEQLAALDGIADRLTSLAADPGNPVPTPAPTV